MSIFEGTQQLAGQTSQSSESSSNQAASTQYAPFALDYLTRLASAGLSQLPGEGDNLVAPLSGLTREAMDIAPTALTRYTTPLDTARTAASDVAGGVTSEDVSRFYNPYEQQVVDEMARQSALNVQQGLMPQMKAAFAGQGGFGSQRYAGALGQALANVQGDLLGQQAKARQAGYGAAVDAALREAGVQTNAAQALTNLGSTEQTAATAGLKSLSDLGKMEQEYEQAQIEAPIARIQNIAQALRGYPMQTSSSSGTSSSSSTGTGTQYSYGNSPLAQIGGLGSLVGAVFGGSSSNPNSLGNRALSWLFGGSGSSGGGGGSSDTSLMSDLRNWAENTPDYNYPTD